MNTFKAGQVVKLKCGGPKLVVASASGDHDARTLQNDPEVSLRRIRMVRDIMLECRRQLLRWKQVGKTLQNDPETLTIIELFPEELWGVNEGEVVNTFTMRGVAAYAGAALEWAKEKADGAQPPRDGRLFV